MKQKPLKKSITIKPTTFWIYWATPVQCTECGRFYDYSSYKMLPEMEAYGGHVTGMCICGAKDTFLGVDRECTAYQEEKLGRENERRSRAIKLGVGRIQRLPEYVVWRPE